MKLVSEETRECFSNSSDVGHDTTILVWQYSSLLKPKPSADVAFKIKCPHSLPEDQHY